MVSEESGFWKENLDRAFSEIRRVLKHNGTLVIIETLGTGFQLPHPPNHLIEYYNGLESDHGFSSTWIRTDYRFPNNEKAEKSTRFFFGDELANKVKEKKLISVLECTGIWWKRW